MTFPLPYTYVRAAQILASTPSPLHKAALLRALATLFSRWARLRTHAAPPSPSSARGADHEPLLRVGGFFSEIDVGGDVTGWQGAEGGEEGGGGALGRGGAAGGDWEEGLEAMLGFVERLGLLGLDVTNGHVAVEMALLDLYDLAAAAPLHGPARVTSSPAAASAAAAAAASADQSVAAGAAAASLGRQLVADACGGDGVGAEGGGSEWGPRVHGGQDHVDGSDVGGEAHGGRDGDLRGGRELVVGRREMVVMPSEGLAYRLLLSPNALAVSRMCGILAACRRRLQLVRQASRGGEGGAGGRGEGGSGAGGDAGCRHAPFQLQHAATEAQAQTPIPTHRQARTQGGATQSAPVDAPGEGGGGDGMRGAAERGESARAGESVERVEGKRARQETERVEAQVARYNKFLTDFCNCMWRCVAASKPRNPNPEP